MGEKRIQVIHITETTALKKLIDILKGEITMRGMTTLAWLVLFAGLAGGEPAPAPSTKLHDAIQAEVAALKPADHVWRAIAWKTCPLEALKAARAQNKPVIAWVFLGIPTDERC